MPKKIKIKYVSQKEMNEYLGEPHGHVSGYGDYVKNLVLVRKGSPEYIRLHEEYHVKAKSPTKPRNPRDFIDDEINANLYSYKRVKRPGHTGGIQMAIFNQVKEAYKLPPSKTMKIMKSVVESRKDIPKAWQDDFGYVKKKYNEFQKSRKH